MKIISEPTERKLLIRQEDIAAFILHTTGDTDLGKILRYYRSKDGLQPHYVIALDGTVYQIAAEDLIAYHAKIEASEARLYERGFSEWSCWVWHQDQAVHVGEFQSNYVQWRDTWQPLGLQSPLDLVTNEHPNSRSIGIELQQPVRPGADIFTDAQYASLCGLLVDSGKRNKVPIDRTHVLGHYDVSPMRRSTARGSWDPGNINWNKIWDGVR